VIELLATWASVATPSPAPVDKSKVEAGVIGLIFLVVMGGAVVALIFSMRRHLGRIDVTRHDRETAAKPPAPPEQVN
jgi:hypothetical protein